MSSITEMLISADFLKIAIPAGVGIIAWYLNEREKLIWEQYKRKEENYKNLIRCSEGFYVGNVDKDLKAEFLYQVKLCWLYAPDNVIQQAYFFLEGVHEGALTSEDEKLDRMRVLIYSIRQDSLERKPLKKTKLTDKDFRHLMAR